MSMNKMFKKVLAVVAAGAMTMGMAMPTFAADGGKTTEAWITKTYYTEVGKAEKFSFTAEQVKTGTGIITTDAAVTMPEISFFHAHCLLLLDLLSVSLLQYTHTFLLLDMLEM